MDSPYCSCKLTRFRRGGNGAALVELWNYEMDKDHGQQVRRGLQLQSLWIIPNADVS